LDWHGEWHWDGGRLQDAIGRWRDAQAVWEKLVAGAPKDATRRWRLGVRLEGLGYAYVKTGRFQETEAAPSPAPPIWEKLVSETNLPDHRYHLGCNRKALGYVFHQTGRFKEAERAYQSALPVWEKLVADFNQPDHRGHLVTTRTYLIQVLVRLAEQ